MFFVGLFENFVYLSTFASPVRQDTGSETCETQQCPWSKLKDYIGKIIIAIKPQQNGEDSATYSSDIL